MATVLGCQDPKIWRKATALESKVFVTPTDTVYGLSCLIENRSAIQRIASLKQTRNRHFLVLVPDVESAHQIVEISGPHQDVLQRYWPGPITFIFPGRNHTDTLAVRLPADPFLIQLMRHTGPIISTSCNPHESPPALSVTEAQDYFGDSVDLYFDGGTLTPSPASTLVDMTCDPPKVLRQGTQVFTQNEHQKESTSHGKDLSL